ncbi:prophage tail fiber N-terminal domain-containing protein [Escherichia coli]|uniref:prophage tail fiber N-terminal domain-containing protein n=2 Tax=Escherichia coli TaxID=562 RepID=UPI0006A62432|nr:prophage tail fiber N-terminal domain-containing protein [Escherichia coli]
MAIQISGILKDGTGKAVQNCTIELKAKRTSATVIVHTVASHDPDKAGRYSMAVEPGQYQVSLHVQGWPPSYAGIISVYQDSKPGSLNDFLGAMTEDDLRPEALRRFEQMVDIVARQAEATTGDMQKAGQYAEKAGRLATQVEGLAGEVQQKATAVAESERNTRQLAETVAQRAGDTERVAGEARESAAQAGQHAQKAQQNAGQTAKDVLTVTNARDAAVRAREGAESALAATVQQAGIATQRAEEAGNAVKQATRQAELTTTARNETVSARDETAAFAREVADSVSQINQKMTTATGAAERAEKAADTTTTNAEKAAASAGNAAKDREATQTLTQRAETAAGRAEEIAGAFNLEDASLEKKGIVRLSSATDSDSETEAATSKAVKKAIEIAGQKYTAQDATTTQKGVVQLSSATDSDSETEAATPKAVRAAYDLANGKAPSVHTHAWNQVAGVPAASLTARGITQLSSATNSVSETLAATPRAVKAVMDETGRKAPLNSPALTGTPTAPTAEQSVNNTQIATTAFVKAAIAAMVASAPAALDTLNELAAALGNDPKFATTMLNALAGKQPLNGQLTAFSQLAGTPDTLPYFDSKRQLSLTNISEAARTLLAMTTKEAMQEHLGGGQGSVTAGQLMEILAGGGVESPAPGSLILAVYIGPFPETSASPVTTIRGRPCQGSLLRTVDICLDNKSAGNAIVAIDSRSLPGTYKPLSGSRSAQSFTKTGKTPKAAISLFIRVA